MVKRTLVCPYKSTSNRKCSHKECQDNCIFNNAINCPIFQKWIDKASKQLKDDFYAVESQN